MATIKSYTDLEQSKKLAEILPIESADMYWFRNDTETPKIYPKNMMKDSVSVTLPCWSLTALLGVIPILNNRSPVIPKTFDGKYRVLYHSTAYEKAIYTEDYDNPVDACVTMIENLHELNLL